MAERVDASVAAGRLAGALAALEPGDRDVLLLTSRAGLDATEVAGALEALDPGGGGSGGGAGAEAGAGVDAALAGARAALLTSVADALRGGLVREDVRTAVVAGPCVRS